MLDTWRPGRKQRIRAKHIMAAENIRQYFFNLPPQIFHDDPVTQEQRALMEKIKYHENQANMWGQSIHEFGDDED